MRLSEQSPQLAIKQKRKVFRILPVGVQQNNKTFNQAYSFSQYACFSIHIEGLESDFMYYAITHNVNEHKKPLRLLKFQNYYVNKHTSFM